MSSTNQIIRNLELSDLPYLEANLLPINKEEIMAMRGQTITELFTTNPDMLAVTQVLVIGDDIICVGNGMETDVGFVIWLFATEASKQHKRAFLTVSSQYVDDWKANHDVLYSYVYAENDLSKNWLPMMGFKINPEPEACGVNGELFHYFEWRKECA